MDKKTAKENIVPPNITDPAFEQVEDEGQKRLKVVPDNNKKKSAFLDIIKKNKAPFIAGCSIIILLVIVLIIVFNKRSASPQVYSPRSSARGMPENSQEVIVQPVETSYKIASGLTSGWFTSGQEASIMLSGINFNNSGGPLLFNHPGKVATDGKHLLLADRNNNRVLIWNSLPDGNQEPDMVLGQTNFQTNNPGKGLNQLNWPVSVVTDGTHVLVADTYNDRVLVWNKFPTTSGQPADYELKSSPLGTRGAIGWPWDVWTDGDKVIVTSTFESQVLIWNSFPTDNTKGADVVIKLNDFGTPRSIGCDGKHLIIGDHNAFKSDAGNFFWKTFPTKNDQKYDFFMANVGSDLQPPPQSQRQFQNVRMGEIFWGPTFTPGGKLVLISDKLHFFNKFPENEDEQPEFSIGGNQNGGGYDFGGGQSGDGSGIALAGNRLYISLANGNKIVGYNNLPQSANQAPDFAIGSPDIDTNTLETEFVMSNPVPATDGKSLFVSSDFDRKLYVWKNLPDESGAHPDFVYFLPDAPWDNALYANTLVLAGKQTVYIWKKLPTNGEKPDLVLRFNIGNVTFNEIIGVAVDEKYFYISDSQAGKIYVWEGIPDQNSDPVYTINCDNPGRLSSDGQYLVNASTLSRNPGGSVLVYQIDRLPNIQPTVLTGMFNLPQGALVYDGHLFVGDTGFNTVHIWNNIKTAIVGKPADIFLGEKGNYPQIGKDLLFWPAVPAFDGKYLWVGEFKFSERLLRFDPS